ncbi:MAG: DUF2157 domain-containing protein [Acidobacteria bacterium]|nr:DUF2157 domain-containing protein [Acidobacteriota bacterium]
MARDWLQQESERWTRDGLISEEQRQRILSRYPDEEASPLFGGATLAWLAWLLGGFGLILLVAWNWDGLPQAAKVGGTAVLTLGAYVAAAVAHRAGASGRAELLAFAGALISGAFIAAVTEAWFVGDTPTWPLFTWAAVIAVTAFVVASPATTALGAGVLLFWAMTGTGEPPASWGFLLIFPVLAIALERRSHWVAAGIVSVALGGWVTLTSMELWRTPSAAPIVFLLAIGAALDAWAHRDPSRRPEFARTTPALAFMIGGFALLAASALSRSSSSVWLTDPVSMGPALALLVALLVVACWPGGVAEGRAPLTRSQWVGGAAVIWTVIWIATAAAAPMPAWAAWFALFVSTTGLVGLAISAIGESATVHSRAVLIAGVVSILTLILVHITAGPNRFGRSALVLLVSAAALWWSTSRHRASPVAPKV